MTKNSNQGGGSCLKLTILFIACFHTIQTTSFKSITIDTCQLIHNDNFNVVQASAQVITYWKPVKVAIVQIVCIPSDALRRHLAIESSEQRHLLKQWHRPAKLKSKRPVEEITLAVWKQEHQDKIQKIMATVIEKFFERSWAKRQSEYYITMQPNK